MKIIIIKKAEEEEIQTNTPHRNTFLKANIYNTHSNIYIKSIITEPKFKFRSVTLRRVSATKVRKREHENLFLLPFNTKYTKIAIILLNKIYVVFEVIIIIGVYGN